MSALSANFVKRAGAGLALLTLAACATPPCETTVVSGGGRRVIADGTSDWRGSERYQTVCNYQHATPPGNFNLPGHIGLGGNSGSQSPTGSSARVLSPR